MPRKIKLKKGKKEEIANFPKKGRVEGFGKKVLA